jgi:hypothetical protein
MFGTFFDVARGLPATISKRDMYRSGGQQTYDSGPYEHIEEPIRNP